MGLDHRKQMRWSTSANSGFRLRRKQELSIKCEKVLFKKINCIIVDKCGWCLLITYLWNIYIRLVTELTQKHKTYSCSDFFAKQQQDPVSDSWSIIPATQTGRTPSTAFGCTIHFANSGPEVSPVHKLVCVGLDKSRACISVQSHGSHPAKHLCTGTPGRWQGPTDLTEVQVVTWTEHHWYRVPVLSSPGYLVRLFVLK